MIVGRTVPHKQEAGLISSGLNGEAEHGFTPLKSISSLPWLYAAIPCWDNHKLLVGAEQCCECKEMSVRVRQRSLAQQMADAALTEQKGS